PSQSPPSPSQFLPVLPVHPSLLSQHGRLKLRPPDSARRRQREEKLRHYREAMDALLGGAPPAQVLSLTGSVLAANPDVGTCWNLRRRALGALGGDWVPSELSFVGQCLGVNPKSYGAWHHRGWVLGHAAAPPAGREDLALRERLLAADPRNCESHWNSGTGEAGALPPERLKEELELVQNAVFTDPTDQSAWVYLRCILSRAPPPPRIICVYVDREDASLAVIFSRPVRVNPECPELTATLDGSTLNWFKLVYTGPYWFLLVCTGLYWAGCLLTLALLLAALEPRGHAQEIRQHLRSLQVSATGLYWFILVYTGLHWEGLGDEREGVWGLLVCTS
ncbi:PREDICTED: geranylgeranyl transferase type-2 subunit alpha, partial [Corvus brachyrhynchos]|uniref:geranylgeranyl transferase type-2 subunit alpha n=1 Tax=Corvus brachyrhynchos TaxID=85066 RepID=UPI00081673D3